MNGPPEVNTHHSLNAVAEQNSSPQALLGAIRFFQQYISPTDGARCQFSPTCSSFGHQAITIHGPWLGLFMTTDRLMRCGFLTNRTAYPTLQNGRLSDPVPPPTVER